MRWNTGEPLAGPGALRASGQMHIGFRPRLFSIQIERAAWRALAPRRCLSAALKMVAGGLERMTAAPM